VTLPAPGQRDGNGGGAAGSKPGVNPPIKPAPGAKPALGATPAVGAAKADTGANSSANTGARRGGGFGLDPADPAVAKAMKACESLRPAGGFGGGGPGGRGGFGNPAMQACLTKKGVNLAPPAPGSGGAAGAADGNRPAFDAKTQAAFEACRKEVG
jgi:hypothetical protein